MKSGAYNTVCRQTSDHILSLSSRVWTLLSSVLLSGGGLHCYGQSSHSSFSLTIPVTFMGVLKGACDVGPHRSGHPSALLVSGYPRSSVASGYALCVGLSASTTSMTREDCTHSLTFMLHRSFDYLMYVVTYFLKLN